MIDPALRWFKIRFASDDESQLRARSLVAEPCLHAARYDGFSIYCGYEYDDENTEYFTLYFSPKAALACEALTKPFNLQPCESPTEARWICGEQLTGSIES